jgi:hypothetical protein
MQKSYSAKGTRNDLVSFRTHLNAHTFATPEHPNTTRLPSRVRKDMCVVISGCVRSQKHALQYTIIQVWQWQYAV